ncbi:MAG: hypothetical protein WCL28_09850 [bacterium]
MIKQIKNSLGMKYSKSAVVVASIFGSLVFQACNESNFSGGAAKSGARGGIGTCKKPPCNVVPPGPRPPVSLDMEFSGDKKIEPIQNTKIWTATKNGFVKRLTIDGDKITETKLWLGAGGTLGMRTYVTEGGFMGARSPMLYFFDPEKATIAKSKNLNVSSETRICIASYMKNGQRFMIAAWGSGNFQEYAMDDQPPFAPKWEQAPTRQGQIQMVGTWGYSCFIDQQQKIFYSQMSHMGAIDLNTYQAANIATTAPNANFRSTTPGVSTYAMGSVKTSYAMSGDSYGNVYNGAGYTSAYDKASDSVWFSHGAQIVVIDRKCLTTQNPCNNFTSYSPGVTIGPMSPLKDGRIVGLVRGTGGIYLMKLRDKTNLKSGLDAVNIGSAGGDPYMYTDFTGATLYINESEQTFKPVEMAQFSASKPIKTAVFKWKPTSSYAAGNLSVEWRNIKLEARCYSNAASKPAFVEIAKVHPSDKGTELNVPSCSEGKYEHVDVKLTQLNNDSSLAGIDTISVGFKQ